MTVEWQARSRSNEKPEFLLSRLVAADQPEYWFSYSGWVWSATPCAPGTISCPGIKTEEGLISYGIQKPRSTVDEAGGYASGPVSLMTKKPTTPPNSIWLNLIGHGICLLCQLHLPSLVFAPIEKFPCLTRVLGYPYCLRFMSAAFAE